MDGIRRGTRWEAIPLGDLLVLGFVGARGPLNLVISPSRLPIAMRLFGFIQKPNGWREPKMMALAIDLQC